MSMPAVLDKAGLQAIILSLLPGSPQPTTVCWALDPKPFVSDQDRYEITLQLFSMTGGIDVDEHRSAFGPSGYPPDNLVITEVGNRTMRITIKAEAFDATVEASEIIDWIRTGIRTEASVQALNAINIAFVHAETTTNVNTIVDERHVNCAIADFTFAGVAVLVSDTNAPYILTVNGNNIVPGELTQ